MDWPEASAPPNLNIVGIDPELVDPKHGDFRPGPAAAGYGCQTLPPLGDSRFAGVPLTDGPLAEKAFAARGGADSWPDPSAYPRAHRPGAGRSSIEVSGAIAFDTIWDADTVRVVGDVAIGDGITLTVAPGTRIEFVDFYRLTVLGRLLAVGSVGDPIVFTTDEPEAFSPDTTSAGCWNGIRFPWTSSINEESRLEHCVVEFSKALGDEPWGGALSVVGFSKLLVRNSILRNNVADYGGAVFCSHQAAPVLVGNLIEGNSAFLRGSAIYVLYSYPDVTNCTIVSNDCLNEEPFDDTGAIHSHIAKPRTKGSILWDNSSAYFIATQIREGKGYYTTFSDLEYGHAGEGNIDEDPLFVGFGGNPLALLEDSPCMNAGETDTCELRLPPVDIAGEQRIDEGRIDIGAYEGPGGTGVDGVIAETPFLSPGRPNPFRSETRLAFSSPGGPVTASVYDVAGRKVHTLLDRVVVAGEQEIRWGGTDDCGRCVASGVYFIRVETSDEAGILRVVLIR
jgi:hypothetical protein